MKRKANKTMVILTVLLMSTALMLNTSNLVRSGKSSEATQAEADPIIVGLDPTRMAVNPATNMIYVNNQGSNTIQAISGATDTVAATITLYQNPIGIAVNPTTNKVYVCDYLNSAVSVIDGVTNSVTATIPVGYDPFDVAVNPVTDTVYVAHAGLAQVSVINGATDTVTATISAGIGPSNWGVAVNPDTNTVYVTGGTAVNNVQVIDGATNTVTTTIPVGSCPTGVAVDNKTNTVYVANRWDNTVSVINGTTNTVTATISAGIGNAPASVAVNPVINTVFVANTQGNTVSIIDGSTNSVTTTIPVGNAPCDVQVNPLTYCVYVANAGDNTVSGFRWPAVHEADSLWVEDATTGATSYTWNTFSNHVGDHVTVQFCLNLSTTESLLSWQVRFDWPSFLTLSSTTAGTKGPWMDGYADTETSWILENATEGVAFDSLLTNATYSSIPGHVGVLFTVTFSINSEPNMLISQLTGAIDVDFYNGTDTWYSPDGLHFFGFTCADDLPITYTWPSPTTHPYMIISGAGTNSTPLVYGPISPRAVGTTFTATVNVTNLAAAWSMSDTNFTLTWNSTVIDALGAPTANFTLAPGWSAVVDTFAPGGLGTVWTFNGIYSGTGSGSVAVATLTFTVLIQETCPPYPVGWIDSSYIVFPQQVFSYPGGTLTPDLTTTDPLRSGYVEVFSSGFPLPYLEVVPGTTIVGPAPSVGTFITVNVDVENLTEYWYCVGIQYTLEFDTTVLSCVSASEGSFFQNPTWNLYGTFFIIMVPPYIPPDFGDSEYPVLPLIIDQLNPNKTTGIYDQTTFPNTIETSGVNATLTTFVFQVLQQNSPGGANITASLNILPFFAPTPSEPYSEFFDRDYNFIINNPEVQGTVMILCPPRLDDVAVTRIVVTIPHGSTEKGKPLWVYQGMPVYVNVTIWNNGTVDETVNVTLFYNATAGETEIGARNINISAGQNGTVPFVWDTTGVPYNQNYTLTANATIPMDISPGDNTLSAGPVTVRIMGDINGDGKVDGRDITIMAHAFGTRPGDPRWNPDADLNGDGRVDGKDITMAARNFGK